jgi:hypothetical protein
MKSLFVVALFAGIVATFSGVSAAGGCGPGCHVAQYGGCVADGWGTAPVRNECPAGARPHPPCGPGFVWRRRMATCFPN